MKLLLIYQVCVLLIPALGQSPRSVGRLTEVYAWKQLTYDIGGTRILQDRFAEGDLADSSRDKRSSLSDDNLYFNDDNGAMRDWNQRPSHWNAKPIEPVESPASINPNDEIGRFFIQYNNVPMGAERVGDRLFITIPRRRYGIPATLNYIDLSQSSRSPPLTPYPDMRSSRSVISVYRTRADECGRLWAVDTGAIEIPNNVVYLQRPSIVVYDLNTDRQILRYQLKSSDLPANNTATGLASITIELKNGDCSDAFAYIADVVTYGIIVFSLKQNDSWRHSHNYFSFLPTAGTLNVAGQSFTWNDGVFSVTLGRPGADGCRTAYFHPMVSTQEFSVSTCELQKTQANQTAFTLLGDRGDNTQCTMHALHQPSNVMFFADIGRNSLSCWNVNRPLNKENVQVLAMDENRISYPSDLHITGDEVWMIANKLPRFIYSRLNTNEDNFFIYKAKVADLIQGTACASNHDTESNTDPSSTWSFGNNYNRNTKYNA